MRQLLLTLLLLSATALHAATDTTRIYFIGNSFTYTYDVPGMVKGFADSAGQPVVYGQHTPGGISVGDISQDTFAHWRNAEVFGNLRLGNWNYVVLQDNQGRFIYNRYGWFPSPSVSRVVEGHVKIRDSMKYYSPCANMILFAGWAFKDGYMPYGATATALNNNIYGNYHYLNDSMHEIVSPIGIAWNTSIAMDSTIDLWGPDRTHQSQEGSYLTAAVLYSSMFKTSPLANNFTGGIDTAVARRFRQIAWTVVMDSAHSNHLDSLSLPVSRVGNTLFVPAGYTGLQWYKDGVTIPGATSLTLTLGAGIHVYTVSGYTSGGCFRRSMPFTATGTTGMQTIAGEPYSLYPNPAIGVVRVTGLSSEATISVTDQLGKVVIRQTIQPGGALDITTLHTGVYVVSIAGTERRLILTVQ